MRTEADFNLGLDLKGVAEADGDLYIEGWASDFGLDDEAEYFEPGSFRKSVQAFIESGNLPLLYHHKPSQALGAVEKIELRGNGLWMKARIDKPAPGSWAEDIYNKVKRGTIKGLSVGGVFRRRMGSDGRPRIYEAGLREISVTPLPINPRTLFSLAQKAFPDDLEDHEPTDEELLWLEKATETLERLERIFERVGDKTDAPSSDD